MSREMASLSNEVQSTIRNFQQGAPVKLSGLARALGVSIKAATLAPGISGEIRPNPEQVGGFLIRVNRHDSARRQRFTVAHEIGHYLLHRDQIGTGIEDDVLYRSSLTDFREAEANRMAADILMPKHLVDVYVNEARALGVEDVVAFVSDRLDVSEAAMKIRLGM